MESPSSPSSDLAELVLICRGLHERMTDDDRRELFAAWYLEDDQTDAVAPIPLLWIGAQEPSWLWREDADGRYMLSGARAIERHGGRPWPRATVPVMWDSGAYIHLKQHGRWTWPAHDYAAYTMRACRGLGTVRHIAPQDWMCETEILLKTHAHELRSHAKADQQAWLAARRDEAVLSHQRRTVASFIFLRATCRGYPIMPVLQGYHPHEYLRCAQLYRDLGVDLDSEEMIGVGTICRRPKAIEIRNTLAAVADGLGGEAGDHLHAFGVKSDAAFNAALDSGALHSTDSMAWSSRARRLENDLRMALAAALGMLPPTEAAALREWRRTVFRLDPAAHPTAVALLAPAMQEFVRWKAEHSPRSAANSRVFAEQWRRQQQTRLVEAGLQRMKRLHAQLGWSP